MTTVHGAGVRAALPDAVLFASYGTSREDARAASIAHVADELARAFGAVPVEADVGAPGMAEGRTCAIAQADADGCRPPIFAEAYTSAKARRVLDRRGEHVPDPAEALRALAAAGARSVLVQPGHLVHGDAFALVEAAVRDCSRLFDRVALGEPLLTSENDVAFVAQAIDAAHPARPDEALVLVAHGVERVGERGVGPISVYRLLQERLRDMGRDDVFVGCMREEPTLEDVRRELKDARALDPARFAVIRLVPLMLTAAAHASRDIAGSAPGSWRTALESDGFAVTAELTGLGSLPAVRELYVDHARAAWAR